MKRAATAQVTALIENAKELEQKEVCLQQTSTTLSNASKKRAMAGVLAGFEAIGIVVAEQAAEAAWNVVAAALKTATGLAFIG